MPLPDSAARILQVRRTGKGCLSYLIGADGEAAVVDAALEPTVYLNLAQREGWRITIVIDTHIHADHLSCARALVAQTGATLYLPVQDRVAFPFVALDDGDAIPIGSSQLTALRTPGHTEESTCYLLDDRALCIGATLFLNAVGRPDLHATRARGVLARTGILLFRRARRVTVGAKHTAILTLRP